MREIKHRVWDKKNNVWVDYELHELGIEFDLMAPDMEGTAIGSDGTIWLLDECGNYGCLDSERFIALEFTGLKDKNGKEIYEGDIIEIELSPQRAFTDGRADIFRVEVFYGMDGFHGRRIGDEQSLYSIRFGGSAVIRNEVIGNIYENPELLKSENDPSPQSECATDKEIK